MKYVYLIRSLAAPGQRYVGVTHVQRTMPGKVRRIVTGVNEGGGTVVRIVDIPPERRHAFDPEKLRQRGCKTTPDRSAKHPGFHATDTVDYAICLEGEIWAMLDDAETLMRPGDVLIQRGTYHAWSKRSDRNARMLFVLIDAEPLENH